MAVRLVTLQAAVLESASMFNPQLYIIARSNPARTSSPTSLFVFFNRSLKTESSRFSARFIGHFDKGVENVYQRTRTNQAPGDQDGAAGPQRQRRSSKRMQSLLILLTRDRPLNSSPNVPAEFGLKTSTATFFSTATPASPFVRRDTAIPKSLQAIQEQAAQLIHMCGTDYYYRHMPQLAEKLDAIVPVKSPTRTHFANSGTEAVETALKLAMHATGREKFIGFFNSFHGRTFGSLSLTSSKAAQRSGFKRQALDVVHVPYPNEFRNPFNAADCGDGGAGQGALNWIEERLFKTTTPPEEVAGIVVEAVQGEGGYVPAPKGFLQGLRRICDEHGILLIVDEVQSGMGRTGKMFACEHYDVQADIVTALQKASVPACRSVRAWRARI